MKKIKILIMTLLLTLPFLSFTQNEKAKVIYATGKVDVQRQGFTKWTKVKSGMIINLKDKIRTGGGRSFVQLKRGGLVVKLHANTNVVLAEMGNNIRINLNQGKLWSSYKPLSGFRRPFFVRSPTSLVGVRGTSFVFQTTLNIDRLLVIKNEVEFSGLAAGSAKKIIKAGELALFKGGKIIKGPASELDKAKILKGFAIIIPKKKARQLYWSRFRRYRRFVFRRQIRRVVNRFHRTRRYVSYKRGDDRSTRRVVTDKDGNVVQIYQVMRKYGNNKVRIYNVTSKNNFYNIMQYTGTFKNPVPNSLDKVKAMDNEETYKDMYIYQYDAGQTDRMRIEEDKVNDIQSITINGTYFYNTDSTKLEQQGNNEYLSSNFKTNGGTQIMTLKVYALNEDGKVLTQPGTKFSINSFMSGSLEFVFESFNTGITGTSGPTLSINSSVGSIRFNTPPDVGFIVWIR